MSEAIVILKKKFILLKIRLSLYHIFENVSKDQNWKRNIDGYFDIEKWQTFFNFYLNIKRLRQSQLSLKMNFSRFKILNLKPLTFNRYCQTEAAAPLTKISFFEEILHSSFMIFSMLSFPTYVACNIVNWRTKKKPIKCPEDEDND